MYRSVIFLLAMSASSLGAADWPSFRGPNASGVVDGMFEAGFSGDPDDHLPHLLLILRSARNRQDRVEVAPEGRGVECRHECHHGLLTAYDN